MVFRTRILVHDYSGHPLQMQLSRSLARRGHTVLHLFSRSFQTPKGNLDRQADDPDGLEIVGLSLNAEFQKNSFFKRRSQEVEFGQLVAAQIMRFRPDIVLSSNAPLDTQAAIHEASRAAGARFVFWLQDLYSEAIGRILPRKIPVVGNVVASRYHRLEYALLRNSDHVVAITEDFMPALQRNGMPPGRVSVIENWAPLNELEPFEAADDGIQDDRTAGGLRAVYSGTLGYKHDPGLLIEAAKAMPGVLDVFCEGRSAEGLARAATTQRVSNLRVRPWVAFADLPKVLASADILLAMIGDDAGAFSVPSKILTYLCIGRPILAAIPRGNLARRIIEREHAGLVSDPGDAAQFIANLQWLAGDAELRRKLGANGRAYAAAHFDIDRITDRFQAIFDDLLSTELQAV